MAAPKVTIIDYGVGNLLSVQRGLERCGAEVILASDPETIFSSDRLVLPGVGAFPKAVEALNRLRLIPIIQEFAQLDKPLLAICLGMQLLMDQSEEFGDTPGLGIIPGSVVLVPTKSIDGNAQKIPHIGWSELRLAESRNNWDGTVLADNQVQDSVYFVHSYMAMPSDQAHRVADVVYGGHRISAVVSRNAITGCQFHPEKSGDIGLRILRNFVSQ